MTYESERTTGQPELGALVPEIIAILGGVISAMIVVLPLNTFLAILFGPTVLIAPFTEEPLKVIGVAYLAVSYPSAVASKTRGFILGGLAGLGFAFTENIIYVTQGSSPISSILRALVCVPMHIGASSLVGAGLVFLALYVSNTGITSPSALFQRIQSKDFLFFIGLAIAYHFLYNLTVSLFLPLGVFIAALGFYMVYRIYQYLPENFEGLVIDDSIGLLRQALLSKPSEVPVKTLKLFCSNCGAKLSDGDTFCQQCGNRIK